MDKMRALRHIVVVAGFLGAAAAFAGGRKEQEGAMMTKQPAGTMTASGKEADAGAMAPEWKVMFTDIEAAKALAEKGPTVLFFSANWCPTCQAAFKDLEANGSKMGNVRIVVVDYDTSAQLKRTYGVTYQHTWIQIDPKGTALKTWSGGGVDEILKHVGKM